MAGTTGKILGRGSSGAGGISQFFVMIASAEVQLVSPDIL